MDPAANSVITIYKCDLIRLNPPEYLNDSLIDLKINYMLANLSESKRKRIYVFSSLFYTKLTYGDNDHKSSHNRVARWTKRVNIFDFDYLFFPINFSIHWSLVVVCKPEQHINRGYRYNVEQNEACLVHMDSCGNYHNTSLIAKQITNYLSYEWKVTRTIKNIEFNLFKKIPIVKAICPQQINGYDCGVYIIKYVEVWFEEMPTTTRSNQENRLSPPFSNDMFTPQDITQERIKYKNLLIQLAREWKAKEKLVIKRNIISKLLENVLFLGMANTNYATLNIFNRKINRIYGQSRRDSIRLNAFSTLFNVKCYTIDNKHDNLTNEHLYANFNNPRRLHKTIDDIFLNRPIFKWIFLDYFFSPVNYYNYFK